MAREGNILEPRYRSRKKKPPLNVTLKNFGPIIKGTLELKPLTILVGPNNSGKSYATTAVFNAIVAVSSEPILRVMSEFSAIKTGFLMSQKVARAIVNAFVNRASTDSPIHIPHHILVDYLALYERMIGEKYRALLIKSFAVPIAELRRNKRHYPRVIIEKPPFKLTFKIAKKNVRAEIECPEAAELLVFPAKNQVRAAVMYNGTTISEGTMKSLKTEDAIYGGAVGALFAIDSAIASIMDCGFGSAFYLPAARSGVTQTYKVLAAGTNLLFPVLDIDEYKAQRYSGAIGDLVNNIVSIRYQESNFAQIARELESEMFSGEVSVNLPKHERGAPDIVFEANELKHPIHATASSVAELAPLLLYLKHYVRKDSMLIIEEPEAHLDPSNQTRMARCLVNLVNHGVNLMITTHSDFLIEAINNAIGWGFAPEGARKERGVKKDHILDRDDVSAYLLKLTKEGSTIKQIPIRKGIGISEEHFAEVRSLLYDETIQIDRIVGFDEEID